MSRITVDHPFVDGKRYIEASGRSTESKPTEGVITGSIFVEVDTGKVFFFDETGSAWVEQFSFQE